MWVAELSLSLTWLAVKHGGMHRGWLLSCDACVSKPDADAGGCGILGGASLPS
jgi:hypothetical protein